MSKGNIPRIIVAGLRGGSGKTILSLSLISIWRKKGLKVTPFKKGPDYIDAGWLALATGRECFNLDLFMMTPAQTLQSFISHTADKTEIAVIEGNRGLYDGVDHEGTYSTAGLSKLLKAPVILVVDCTKVTGTVAAMVLGCRMIDPDVPIKGVVLNNIAGSRQESVIRKAIDHKCGLPVVGAFPKLKKELFPERHMGLTPFQEHLEVNEAIDSIAEIGSKYLDIDAIFKVAKGAEEIRTGVRVQGSGELHSKLKTPNSQRPKIGVIKDSAFQFYYPENFEELKKRGAEIVEVSALTRKKLPDIDALYIGGGFPETHAIALAENEAFKKSLLKAIEKGLPVYAECGGLMYLGKSLVLENKTYPMVGALPLVFDLNKKPQAHGYTIVEVQRDNPFFKKGTKLKGHEFHYSKVIDIDEEGIFMAFKMKRGKGIKDGLDGICYKNVLATYTHLHALGCPEWADGMIKTAKEFKIGSKNI
ncbi:MAG: cobyrinate a,c-diamide synthase [Nitrospirota bacterium]